MRKVLKSLLLAVGLSAAFAVTALADGWTMENGSGRIMKTGTG